MSKTSEAQITCFKQSVVEPQTQTVGRYEFATNYNRNIYSQIIDVSTATAALFRMTKRSTLEKQAGVLECE